MDLYAPNFSKKVFFLLASVLFCTTYLFEVFFFGSKATPIMWNLLLKKKETLSTIYWPHLFEKVWIIKQLRIILQTNITSKKYKLLWITHWHPPQDHSTQRRVLDWGLDTLYHGLPSKVCWKLSKSYLWIALIFLLLPPQYTIFIVLSWCRCITNHYTPEEIWIQHLV